jgi:hypothetical protein
LRKKADCGSFPFAVEAVNLTWNAGTNLYVGKFGSGALSNSAGGVAVSGLGSIGYEAGSSK